MTMGARKRAARSSCVHHPSFRKRYKLVWFKCWMRDVHQRIMTVADERSWKEYESARAQYRIGVRLCPCMLCHGEIGVARCNAQHGAGKPCPFCEPCGTRPKKQHAKWRACDGSGVHFKGQQRLTEEELKPKPELFPFSWDV